MAISLMSIKVYYHHPDKPSQNYQTEDSHKSMKPPLMVLIENQGITTFLEGIQPKQRLNFMALFLAFKHFADNQAKWCCLLVVSLL
jgi:hypothetical protein